MKTDKGTKVSGTCQRCFGAFAIWGKTVIIGGVKVERETMVLHGYKRPDVGYTVGRCWGVGQMPYELDVEVTKAWRQEILTRLLPSTYATITFVEYATVMHWQVTDYAKQERRGYGTKSLAFTKGVPHEHGSAYSAHSFEKVQAWKLKELADYVKTLEDLVKELDRRIVEWVYAPEKLAKTERKAPLVHMARPDRPRASICRISYRAGGNGQITTNDSSVVTCPRCLARKKD